MVLACEVMVGSLKQTVHLKCSQAHRQNRPPVTSLREEVHFQVGSGTQMANEIAALKLSSPFINHWLEIA